LFKASIRKIPIRFFGAIIPLLFWGCIATNGDTLKNIRERGALRVITDNNSNTYYLYRGTAMGFEYDLAAAFADHLGVTLKIVTPGWNRMFEALEEGQGDLIAASLTATASRRDRFEFSDDYLTVQQQIILHRSNRTVREFGDLEGMTVHTRQGTSYQERLLELQRGGLQLNIITHRNVPTEELIRQVAERQIEATVADSNIALLNRRYYPDIRIAFPIEEPQPICWAVRKGDEPLVAEINTFLEKIHQNGIFDKIYRRYYANARFFDYLDLKKFHRRLESRLPKFLPAIRRESRKYGFDWRLIAALVYQESHFDPTARSFTGVRGLMQITEATAREMGIDNRRDPEESIEAGVKYLAKLHGRWDRILDPQERMYFALASYNIGYGHVRDAQKLARKKGWAPDRWPSVKQTLPMLRLRRYYKDTRYGYARGDETVKFVERIRLYYDIIRQDALARRGLESGASFHDVPISLPSIIGSFGGLRHDHQQTRSVHRWNRFPRFLSRCPQESCLKPTV